MRSWCSYDYCVTNLVNAAQTSIGDTNVKYAELTAHGPDEKVETEEHLTTTFRCDQDTWNYEPQTRSEFTMLKPGTTWIITVNRMGAVTKIKSLNRPRK